MVLGLKGVSGHSLGNERVYKDCCLLICGKTGSYERSHLNLFHSWRDSAGLEIPDARGEQGKSRQAPFHHSGTCLYTFATFIAFSFGWYERNIMLN